MPLTLPDGDLDAWLAPLKPFQRAALSVFLKDGGPDDAAKRWLTTTGSPNIVAFGGSMENDAKPFWDLLQAEFRKFVCDDTAYVEEKKGLIGEGYVARGLWISVTSAALGATLGFAATLLAPAIALMLSTAVSIGTNAYCQAGK